MKPEKILKAIGMTLGIIDLAICITIIAIVVFNAFSETGKRATITEGWMTTENRENDFEACYN